MDADGLIDHLGYRGAAGFLDESRWHEEEARRRYARMRRLSLPRNMLARLLEIAVVLDRGAALEESGHAVQWASIFERAVSPRNLALFASRHPERLPGA